ncbi:MAG: ATP-dependent Clp protease adaptor ClpS [Leptospirales bacterium]|nr:ATP-dependent Clp protease adaptor ClpS [Leptospirales bacterium]
MPADFDKHDFDSQLISKDKVEMPKMYRVILHNDHYTTTVFVVEVLIKVFHMTAEKAQKVMLDVHKKGKGVCGVYTLDIAATKTEQVRQMAKMRQFPLKCSYEEA